jgi:2-polyprenyl-3-methyl-5-hydroxy-6-metoxy-1,4-benzoquinol methylase
MKIALCFSGNIRFLHECFPDINKYIIANNDVDIYAHLWWDSSYKGQIIRFHSADRFETRDMDKEFIELYKPKDYIIEVQRKFVDTYKGPPTTYADEKTNILFGQINYFNQLSQYYSKMKANELCEKSGIKYDLVVHLRTDCVVDHNRYFIDSIRSTNYKNELLLVSTMGGGPKYCGHHPNIPSDWFFVGPPNKMSLFTKALYELLYVYRKYEVLHIQDYLKLVVRHIKIPTGLIDSGTSVHRPPTMFKGDDNFVEIHNYFDNFDFVKLDWIDNQNSYLPYYAKYIIFNDIRCIICNAVDFDIQNNIIRKYDKDIYRVIKCRSCNHIQLFPNNYDVRDYYDEDSQDDEVSRISNRDNTEWRNMVKNQAKRRLSILENITNIAFGNIIDIGGGYGDFVEILTNKYPNACVTVLEPSVTRITQFSATNLIKINQLMDTPFSEENKENFDVVTSFHVLEHVLEPKIFIQNCYRLLKPGGLLYIEVPNQNNDLINLSDYYRNNIWYMKAHISYFTVEVVESILNELEIKEYTFYGFERYDHLNYLNWINTNRPQSACTYYNGVPKNDEEKEWIETREQTKKTDCFYVIIRK